MQNKIHLQWMEGHDMGLKSDLSGTVHSILLATIVLENAGGSARLHPYSGILYSNGLF